MTSMCAMRILQLLSLNHTRNGKQTEVQRWSLITGFAIWEGYFPIIDAHGPMQQYCIQKFHYILLYI